MAGRVKQGNAGGWFRLTLLRATQGHERTLQSQTLGRLLLPYRDPKRHSTPQRLPQRRQFARRLHAIDTLRPISRHRHRPGVQKVQAPLAKEKKGKRKKGDNVN